jgi:hypothetical protein
MLKVVECAGAWKKFYVSKTKNPLSCNQTYLDDNPEAKIWKMPAL